MTLIRLTLLALLLAAVTPAFATNPAAIHQGAVVFMYHHFGQVEYKTTNVTLAQFEQHLDLLERDHYQVWPLEKIVAYLRKQQPFPSNIVAITIDDAYKSVYTQAYPRLKAKGWPFTVFVSTAVVDEHLPAYMTWDQMREMHQHQVTFANHSAGHEYLIRELQGETFGDWKKRVTDDIQHAQARLEKELGYAPMLFAYPYGEYSEALASLIASLGYTGFGQQSGAIGPLSDMRILPRFPMAEAFAAIEEFATKAQSMALPVTGVTPWDPQLHEVLQPVMEVSLAPSDARLDQLVCYVSNQENGEVIWLQKYQRFTVRAMHPLPAGRSRYNCTAPSSQAGRYYWFSHLWIR